MLHGFEWGRAYGSVATVGPDVVCSGTICVPAQHPAWYMVSVETRGAATYWMRTGEELPTAVIR